MTKRLRYGHLYSKISPEVSMKINSSKNNKKRLIISLSLVGVILLATAGGLYAYAKMSDDNATINSTTPDRSASDIQQAEDLETSPDNKAETPNTDTPAPTTTNDSGKTVIQVIASADISAGVLSVRGGLNNLVTSDGSCFVLLTGPNGATLRRETTLLQNAATTDCKTISISTGDLTPGTWTYSLHYTSDNATGKSDEATVTIQ